MILRRSYLAYLAPYRSLIRIEAEIGCNCPLTLGSHLLTILEVSLPLKRVLDLAFALGAIALGTTSEIGAMQAITCAHSSAAPGEGPKGLSDSVTLP